MEKNSWKQEPPKVSRRRKRKERPSSQPLNSLQDYALDAQGQQDVVFARRLEESGKSATAKNLPPLTEVLSYIAKMDKQPAWFLQSQESIVNSNALTYPDMDVLTRDYIRDFLREPLNPQEPLCNHPQCESERLGGFRLRALYTPGQKMHNWCYLCHLFYTNRLYFESLNRKEDNGKVFCLHYFCVRVDEPGEYRLDMTLQGEKNVEGLYGPFPIYNCHNYTQTTYGRVRGWAESDVLVFRLSQTAPPLNRTGSSSNTEKASALRPSSPTDLAAPSSAFQ
jgi:hypothetical protein